MQYTLARRIPTHLTFPHSPKIPSKCRDTETGLSVDGWADQMAKIMLAMQTISHQVEYITRQLVRRGSHEGVYGN